MKLIDYIRYTALMEHVLYKSEYVIHPINKNKFNKALLRCENVYDPEYNKQYEIHLIDDNDINHLRDHNFGTSSTIFSFKK